MTAQNEQILFLTNCKFRYFNIYHPCNSVQIIIESKKLSQRWMVEENITIVKKVDESKKLI